MQQQRVLLVQVGRVLEVVQPQIHHQIQQVLAVLEDQQLQKHHEVQFLL